MSEAKRHSHPSGRQQQFIVRLPDGMRERIKILAAENHRSMNSEIVVMLEHVVGKPNETKKGTEAAA